MASRTILLLAPLLAPPLLLGGCSSDKDDRADPSVLPESNEDRGLVRLGDVETPLRVRTDPTTPQLNDDLADWLFMSDELDWGSMTQDDLTALQEDLNEVIPEDFTLSELSVRAGGGAGYCLVHLIDGEGLVLAEAERTPDGSGTTRSQFGTDRKPLTPDELARRTFDLDVCRSESY
jgi:hypothetical protein